MSQVRLAPMRSVNPATGETIAEFPLLNDAELAKRLDAAHTAYRGWQSLDFAERAAPMRKVADLLEAQQEELATMMTVEMGKPIAQARGEIAKCALVCRFYADRAAEFLAPEPVTADEAEIFVAYRPLGSVLAVLPWNFPFFQAFRFCAPAVMAGNAVLIKHAPNVQMVADKVEALFAEAGFPHGLVANLRIEEARVADVIADERIAAVTVTGSSRAGSAVASLAGKALKKVVLELGGSDPYVVLGDADLDIAVRETVKSRMVNGGQSCIGAKRCIVPAEIADDFRARLEQALRAVKVCAPTEEDSQMGPLARPDLVDGLRKQVDASVSAGATKAYEGEVPSGGGTWFPLTLLDNVSPGMPAFDEELFGPVFTIIRARDEDHALELANQSEFGLGAAVFTADLERGRKLAAEHLEAGSCFVNAFVRSDPRFPFGGVKQSGFGRELSSHGIREFVNAKTVYVAPGKS